MNEATRKKSIKFEIKKLKFISYSISGPLEIGLCTRVR